MLVCLFKDTRSTECHVTSRDTSPMLWSRTLLLHPLVWQSHRLLRDPSSSYFFMCIYTHAWCKSISVGLCSKDFSVSHPSILRSPESSCCKSTLTWTFDLWGWGVLSSVRLTEGRTPCQRGMKTANNTTSTVIALSQPLNFKTLGIKGLSPSLFTQLMPLFWHLAAVFYCLYCTTTQTIIALIILLLHFFFRNININSQLLFFSDALISACVQHLRFSSRNQ